MTRHILIVALGLQLAPCLPAAAQPYSVRRSGEVVQLVDAASHTTVSVATSVGNLAVEMTVKGANVLRFPYASVAELAASPRLSGIPFLGPWANRLDEQAFYANGKRYPFNMELGNVRGARPIHGFLAFDAALAGRRGQGRCDERLGDEPPRVLQAAGVDGAVSLAHSST